MSSLAFKSFVSGTRHWSWTGRQRAAMTAEEFKSIVWEHEIDTWDYRARRLELSLMKDSWQTINQRMEKLKNFVHQQHRVTPLVVGRRSTSNPRFAIWNGIFVSDDEQTNDRPTHNRVRHTLSIEESDQCAISCESSAVNVDNHTRSPMIAGWVMFDARMPLSTFLYFA